MSMDDSPLVIKIGGHDIADRVFLNDLAHTLQGLGRPVVIVHGGGAEVSALQRSLGIEPQYVDGVRVTDAASLDVVKMVLAGLVNKRLVGVLVSAGLDAVGITGVDRGLVRARKMAHARLDMGFTGDVAAVRGDVLRDMLAAGITPVIAPLCLGIDAVDGAQPVYNVNADHVAGAVAAAIQASRTVFLTNVEGVLADGQRLTRLDAMGADALINDGTISGGMIPKVRTALSVLNRGVPEAVITNLIGLNTHGGTVFTHNLEIEANGRRTAND